MNATLTEFQVKMLSEDILAECLIKIKEWLAPNTIESEGLVSFDLVLLTKIQAILCTLNNDAYENIVKVTLEKLNLNDLFDNRQKYLN